MKKIFFELVKKKIIIQHLMLFEYSHTSISSDDITTHEKYNYFLLNIFQEKLDTIL
jgi:hypothetical protein